LTDRGAQSESSEVRDGSYLAGGSTKTAGVTVVVVSHNSARHLSALGHALASGSLAPDRMLVVDNASVDDTVARARLAGFDVHETGSNDGFGAACNVALRMTDTEFVLICNPDVLPSPTALEQLATVLTRTKTAAVAGVAFDRPLQARRFSRITGNLWSFLPGWLQRPLKRFAVEIPVDPSKNHHVVDYVVGAFMLCRTAAVCSVGGFDECFFLYSEEEDLCRRLGKQGWQTLFVPSVTVTHEHSTSSDGVDGAAMAPFRFHSLYWYYRRYHSRRYAEFARCTISMWVMIDRAYRALIRQRQVYGPGTAIAVFRSIDKVRRAHERRTARRCGIGEGGDP
jgi:N-acetylglucosaminyl-diphospho-decaprenol L-rhamnosyltransferase